MSVPPTPESEPFVDVVRRHLRASEAQPTPTDLFYALGRALRELPRRQPPREARRTLQDEVEFAHGGRA